MNAQEKLCKWLIHEKLYKWLVREKFPPHLPQPQFTTYTFIAIFFIKKKKNWYFWGYNLFHNFFFETTNTNYCNCDISFIIVLFITRSIEGQHGLDDLGDIDLMLF